MRPETVGGSDIEKSDPLIAEQNKDVASMRASLLSCSSDPEMAVKSIKQITVLRVYHQISRIIRYLEMMDKLEAKLYRAIDHTLETTPDNSTATMMMLLNIQERLQRNMIESHKLLQPYINVDDTLSMLSPVTSTSMQQDYRRSLLPQESRDKVRTTAQAILTQIRMQNPDVVYASVDPEDVSEVDDDV